MNKPELTKAEIAALPAAVGFIKKHSEEVAVWLKKGFVNGDPLPKDIYNLGEAVRHLRWVSTTNRPFPEGSRLVAEKITALIEASKTQAAVSSTEPGGTISIDEQTVIFDVDYPVKK